MSFFRNIYKVATSVCRKDRSLNEKRPNPYVDTTTSSSFDLEEENEIENRSLIAQKENVLDNILEENTGIEEETNESPKGSHSYKDSRQNQKQKMSLVKLSEGYNGKTSQDEQIDTDDIETNSSSEGSEAENNEEHGPYKKRRLDTTTCVQEEEKITKRWKVDLKSIQKSIGRMNRLFEIFERNKNKNDSLTITLDDKMIEEPAIEATQPCEIIEESPKNNLEIILGPTIEELHQFDRQIQEENELVHESPIEMMEENQSRRLSCSQNIIVNMPLLPNIPEIRL